MLCLKLRCNETVSFAWLCLDEYNSVFLVITQALSDAGEILRYYRDAEELTSRIKVGMKKDC